MGQAALAAERSFMEFFNSAIDVLQTLVIALGAGLGIWGVINLLEGYGNDNPCANAHVPVSYTHLTQGNRNAAIFLPSCYAVGTKKALLHKALWVRFS